MIIYSKSFPGGQYHFEGQGDALYSESDSGWIDLELFLKWMHDSKNQTRKVMMECSVQSAARRSHLVAHRLVFWIDCDGCDAWAHTYCAFGGHSSSHRFVCDTCAQPIETLTNTGTERTL